MSLLSNLSARFPFGGKEEKVEYFFALNIGPQNLTVALWTIEHKQLKIVKTSASEYSSTEEILTVTDKLLGEVLTEGSPEPQKILFGVPDSWLQDEDLKEEYMKLLRRLVKELELTPMAYVASSHALSHFIEKQTGTPATAILVGVDAKYVTVTVVRAGKLDGTKITPRGDNLGADIEKLLLNFTSVEVLPSKIILYGSDHQGLDKHKSQLLEYSWMSKLSFLHVPKIETLDENIEIDAVAFAGAVELNPAVEFTKSMKKEVLAKTLSKEPTETEIKDDDEKDFKPMSEEEIKQQLESEGGEIGEIADIEKDDGAEEKKTEDGEELKLEEVEEKEPEIKESKKAEKVSAEEFGFVTGDVEEVPSSSGDNFAVAEADDFESSSMTYANQDLAAAPAYEISKPEKNLSSKFLNRLKGKRVILGVIGVLLLTLLGGYLFLTRADVKIFVEPQILEKDAQIVADPTIKEVNEEENKIPGEKVSIQVSGSGKGAGTGTKLVGDSAKGTVIVYNKTFESKSFSKGTILTASNGFKYTLDVNVSIASQSATDSGISFGKANAEVTASTIGADGNLPSGTELTIANLSSSQVSVKAEGNFSGGTSKEVTVISDADQKKLLAQLASDLKGQAKQKLQEKYIDKKILEEALQEEIVKKSYSKNINDQAREFSLNLTVNFKGTTYQDKDLKQLVSKLVSVNVPEGFELNLSETETLADVSKLEKDGKLIFLARFKAKLIPKIDTEAIKKEIRGKTPSQIEEVLKKHEHILGTEIKLTPFMPAFLQRLPLLTQNISVEVGLK